MNATAQTTFAERAGRNLGRKWSGGMRLERRAQRWLVAHGLPAGVAKAMLLIVRLAVLGVVAYGTFWVALLIAFAVVAAWTARNTDWEPNREPEWRNGSAGFGLYTYDNFRIDPHVYDDD